MFELYKDLILQFDCKEDKNKKYLLHCKPQLLLMEVININNTNLIKTIIKSNNDVNPNFYNNHLFRMAVKNNNIKIIKLLLKDKRVNSKDLNNNALKNALKRKYYKIIKLLLKKNNMCNNFHIKFILKLVKTLNINISQIIVNDKINYNVNNNYLFKYIYMYSNSKLLKTIAKNIKSEDILQCIIKQNYDDITDKYYHYIISKFINEIYNECDIIEILKLSFRYYNSIIITKLLHKFSKKINMQTFMYWIHRNNFSALFNKCCAHMPDYKVFN